MSFLKAPEQFYGDIEDWCRRIAQVVNGAIDGKTNNSGTFTLTPSQATTTITLASGRLGKDTTVLWTPTTANAAAEIGAGGMYLSAVTPGSNTFTITHSNNAQDDRTFDYVLIG